ncbi:MAG: hypothetical protein JJD92_13005 [Frankiaceae bacterium]|nr:hypothetical protein [Frankiaceae bacterium]
MPSVSKTTATKVQDMPPFTEHTDDLDGYTVNFVTLRVDMDLTPLQKGLPDDRCQCPHWGYQFSGTQTFHYPDHDEVVTAGSAFYAPPGHNASATADSEFLVFSPAEQLRETEAVMASNMKALQGA